MYLVHGRLFGALCESSKMNAKVRPTFADVTIFSPTRKQIDDDGAMIEVTSHDGREASCAMQGQMYC